MLLSSGSLCAVWTFFSFMREFAYPALSRTGDYWQGSPVLKLLLCTDGGALPKR